LGSTIKGAFGNPDLVTNVRPSDVDLTMHTNAGSKKITTKCDFGSWKDCFFDSDQMAKVLGLSFMCDHYNVTFNNWVEDAFHVHTEKGIAKLQGLWIPSHLIVTTTTDWQQGCSVTCQVQQDWILVLLPIKFVDFLQMQGNLTTLPSSK
jgi:hypothetical protein